MTVTRLITLLECAMDNHHPSPSLASILAEAHEIAETLTAEQWIDRLHDLRRDAVLVSGGGEHNRDGIEHHKSWRGELVDWEELMDEIWRVDGARK